uniref:RABX5 catalytic core helical domain-containing protein n=1 Tax=Zea mays TaxID=4577 RepID=A0A804MHY6_MAIZE
MGPPCLACETLGAAIGEAWLAAMDVDSRMATESDSDAHGGSGFLVSFSFHTANAEEDDSKVQAFLAEMESSIRDPSLRANATDQEIDHALEGLEKYVMTKLFDRTFGTSTEDAISDMDISEKIGLLQQFVKPHHSDIPKGSANVGKSVFISAMLRTMAYKELVAAAAQKYKPIQSDVPRTTLGPIQIEAYLGKGV